MCQPLTTFFTREITGLDTLVNLEQLWLGRNKINKISVRKIALGSCASRSEPAFKIWFQGLSSLRKLRKLSLQSNRLVELGTGLADLTELEELYLSHNGIERTTGLETLVFLSGFYFARKESNLNNFFSDQIDNFGLEQ